MTLPLRGGNGGLGIRGRLFLVSVLLIAVVGAAGAIAVQRAVRHLVEQRIEAELVRMAAMARVAIEQADPPAEVGAVDALADALGSGGQVRVTIIAQDGRVLGDSALAPAQLATLANHADRPELQRAVGAGAGEAAVTRRHSDTLGRTMVYVALPYRASHGQGVVRTAVDLVMLDTVNRAFALVVFAAAAALLAFAVFMSALASHLASRDLRSVLLAIRDTVQRSQQFARGEAPAAPVAAPADDELAELAGGVQDLAARLADTVAALGAERDRLEALLQSMSEAVLALDPTGRITLANPAAVALLGVEGPPQGRLLLEVVRAPALAEVARAALAQDAGEDAADEIDLPGGQTVVATARPLRGQAGCVLVLHDRTAARRLERVRRDFVANVSHELRTPVAIIRANAESLADGALDEPAVARVFLDAILRNAERLSALIGDLLDLSRIEAGRMDLHPAPVSLHEAAARAATEVQPRVEQARQQLELRVDPALRAWADARALEHILLNLLENASKYTPEGGHIQVVARLEPGGRAVRLAVEDDGPGIPERHRERVFERFYRVDPGRARAQGGTGLGLAIVKHLAESMGGAVGLDPRTPRGSSFWVRLPVRGELPGPA